MANAAEIFFNHSYPPRKPLNYQVIFQKLFLNAIIFWPVSQVEQIGRSLGLVATDTINNVRFTVHLVLTTHSNLDHERFAIGQFFLATLHSLNSVQLYDNAQQPTAVARPAHVEMYLTASIAPFPPHEFHGLCFSFSYFCDQMSHVPVTNNETWTNYWHNKELLFIAHPHSKQDSGPHSQYWFLSYPRNPTTEGLIQADITRAYSPCQPYEYNKSYLVRARVKQMKPGTGTPYLEFLCVLRTVPQLSEFYKLTTKKELEALMKFETIPQTITTIHRSDFALNQQHSTIQNRNYSPPNHFIFQHSHPSPSPPRSYPNPNPPRPPPSPPPQPQPPEPRLSKPLPERQWSHQEEVANGIRCSLEETQYITTPFRRKDGGSGNVCYEEQKLLAFVGENGIDPKSFVPSKIDDYEFDADQAAFITRYKQKFGILG
ncbi:hypothetical protein BLNAU_12778 [Blattamonas nauphoetae]|uniref:Uncharacterized protein n=1 Tax=Blattamonas nauphoetae TaxID=2049346 RepID=A0ABQ9XKH0_9EUKA|nr:hypothetical protein BLNAU_12778 [Blattamonas nauphoetae]